MATFMTSALNGPLCMTACSGHAAIDLKQPKATTMYVESFMTPGEKISAFSGFSEVSHVYVILAK